MAKSASEHAAGPAMKLDRPPLSRWAAGRAFGVLYVSIHTSSARYRLSIPWLVETSFRYVYR